MNRTTTTFLLAVAALVEVGGDALIRRGLHSPSTHARLTLLSLGALVLFVYGCLVNAPPWDFGRLLGVYIVFFFLAAQLLAWLVFGRVPERPIIIGGVLIVSGGLVIAIAAA